MTRIASIRRHHNERSVFWGKLISQSLTRSHERQEARPALECEDRLANDIFIHCKAKTEHAIWEREVENSLTETPEVCSSPRSSSEIGLSVRLE